jgi:hypothetical protein
VNLRPLAVVPATVALLVMGATVAGGPSPATASPGHVRSASASTLGKSFQAIYAVPKGGAVVGDEPAAIRADITAIDGWYDTQTVGHVHPRWVKTSSGHVSVKTVTLAHSAKTYDKSSDELDLIAKDLHAKGWPKATGEKLVVVIDTTQDGSGRACAITGESVSLLTEAACDIYPSASDTWPYGATYVIAHEMAHNFGAVPPCAPHYDGTGHVDDNPKDLLYQGPKQRDWDHLRLDPGHDDYYDTGRTDCTDIMHSKFWTTPKS